jgi:HSP20 family molecular chaperone IbpA
MAYVITPHFVPAHEAPHRNPFGFCAPVPRPAYAYRTVARPQPRRPAYSPYTNFFSQVDELLGEIDREAQRQAHIQAQLEAQREAHRQRQLRKRALRAKFAVIPNEKGWQVDAEVTGFRQENINIEVTDENTLRVAGNTEWRSEPQAQPEAEAVPALEEATEEPVVQTPDNRMNGVTLNEPETETEPARSATPDSDTHSHRSYQPTVEDDFEDLGAETSSLISTPSKSPAPAELKGKEKAVEEPRNVETAVTQQPQPEIPAPQQQLQQEEPHPQGSFERTFRFPERIDASNVRASFKDGILHITVPRAQVQQVRRITIL